jgi:hypothetical protein
MMMTASTLEPTAAFRTCDRQDGIANRLRCAGRGRAPAGGRAIPHHSVLLVQIAREIFQSGVHRHRRDDLSRPELAGHLEGADQVEAR